MASYAVMECKFLQPATFHHLIVIERGKGAAYIWRKVRWFYAVAVTADNVCERYTEDKRLLPCCA